MSVPPSLTDALTQLERYARALEQQLAAAQTAIAALKGVTPASAPHTNGNGHTPARSVTPVNGNGHAPSHPRDREVLRLIHQGTHATSLLRASAARIDGQSTLQHERSVTNALQRLRATGHVANGAHGWDLTDKGRTAAAAAAKEAP